MPRVAVCQLPCSQVRGAAGANPHIPSSALPLGTCLIRTVSKQCCVESWMRPVFHILTVAPALPHTTGPIWPDKIDSGNDIL